MDAEEGDSLSGSSTDTELGLDIGLGEVAYYDKMEGEDEASTTDSSVVEGGGEGSRVGFEDEVKRRQRVESFREDEQFCEMVTPCEGGGGGHIGRRLPKVWDGWDGGRRRRHSSSNEEDDFLSGGRKERVLYPPERAPPIVDFLVIITAFLVAVVAAYFSIS